MDHLHGKLLTTLHCTGKTRDSSKLVSIFIEIRDVKYHSMIVQNLSGLDDEKKLE